MLLTICTRWRRFQHVVCCSWSIGFTWRNISGSQMVTRRCLRAGIMQLSPLELLFGTIKPYAVAGMLQLTVAALQNADTIVFLRAFLVVMATPMPQTSWLLAVDPDAAEALVIVAMCVASLGIVCSDLYNDVTKVSMVEDLL
jgi:ABC-type multidrug transport system permease subunit